MQKRIKGVVEKILTTNRGFRPKKFTIKEASRDNGEFCITLRRTEYDSSIDNITKDAICFITKDGKEYIKKGTFVDLTVTIQVSGDFESNDMYIKEIHTIS